MNARGRLITRAALIASCATACACASDTDDGTPMTNAGTGGSAADAGGASDTAGGAGAGGAGASGIGGTSGTAGVGGVAGTSAGTGMVMGGSGGRSGTGGAGSTGGTSGMEPVMDPEPPFGDGADVYTWSTGDFTLEAGQEQYLCFASTLSEDLIINGYATLGGKPFVHHIIFSRANQPEPEGFAECDVAFKNGWEPLFITGAGATKLEFPQDAGHDLRSGTQLVVQMHLLNASEEPVTGALDIHMRRSAMASPRPVSSYIFGTAAVELPPSQTSEVVGTCPMWQGVQLIAGFPHMHLLGSSMTFEVGSSEADLHEVFKRDPFNFDDQRIEPLELDIQPGSLTRVRCTFDNPHDETIGYGESTHNEMCYFVGFAVDLPSQSACLEVLPPSIFQ